MSLKNVNDQSLIDELKSRGYSISKVENRTIWQQIQEHLHKGPSTPVRGAGDMNPMPNRVTRVPDGASPLNPRIKRRTCVCGHALCDRCFPKGNKLCSCNHLLCPVCNDHC